MGNSTENLNLGKSLPPPPVFQDISQLNIKKRSIFDPKIALWYPIKKNKEVSFLSDEILVYRVRVV